MLLFQFREAKKEAHYLQGQLEGWIDRLLGRFFVLQSSPAVVEVKSKHFSTKLAFVKDSSFKMKRGP